MKWYLLIVATLFAVHGSAVGADISVVDTLKKHMEWGEYDEIITKAEPIVKSNKLPEGPFSASSILKYLGVAYFAKGRIPEARSAFSMAYHVYPQVSLEEYYVSREILDFFAVTLNEEKTKLASKIRADSLANIRVLDSLNSQYRRSASLAAAAFGLSAIAGVATVFEYRIADSLFWLFKAAADGGNRALYETYRSQLKTTDAVTAAAAVVTVIFAVSGTYFSFRGNRVRKAKERFLLKQVSFSIAPVPSVAFHILY